MATTVETPETTDIDAITEAARAEYEKELEKLRPAHEAFLRLEQIVKNFDRVVTGSKRRTRTGQSRPEEFLSLVKASGDTGITVAEAAEKMDGMNPNYLYRIAKDMIADKTITKSEDKRYRAA